MHFCSKLRRREGKWKSFKCTLSALSALSFQHFKEFFFSFFGRKKTQNINLETYLMVFWCWVFSSVAVSPEEAFLSRLLKRFMALKPKHPHHQGMERGNNADNNMP